MIKHKDLAPLFLCVWSKCYMWPIAEQIYIRIAKGRAQFGTRWPSTILGPWSWLSNLVHIRLVVCNMLMSALWRGFFFNFVTRIRHQLGFVEQSNSLNTQARKNTWSFYLFVDPYIRTIFTEAVLFPILDQENKIELNCVPSTTNPFLMTWGYFKLLHYLTHRGR